MIQVGLNGIEIITFEQADEIVMNSAFLTGTEIISCTASFNRILAENVVSDIDMPPFNKSSVDGFACRKSDLNNELEIIETIPAGMVPEKAPGINQCSRIMTGASVPSGADCVIMVEDSELLPSGKIRYKGTFLKENIARKGEDVHKGDEVLKSGTVIRPQDIAVMATVGYTSVTVSKKPDVAVISTGSELVEPSEIPGIAQIRNSNACQLMAQIERAGGIGKYYGIAKDDEKETFTIVEKAILENDIVLITGGVSMGDFDFVPSVLERAGTRLLFTRVAIQPGKPTTFGIHRKALVFGLPGNPVSSFVMFELLVRPLMFRMMGSQWSPVTWSLPMKESFSRKITDRMSCIPVRITGDGLVSPVEFHGSAHISAIPESDGIFMMPVGVRTVEKGKIVNVRQI
jgi:molybdopterin molybdotransferase